MPVGEYSSELTTLTGKMLTIKAADRPTVQDILQDDVMKNTQHRYDHWYDSYAVSRYINIIFGYCNLVFTFLQIFNPVAFE